MVVIGRQSVLVVAPSRRVMFTTVLLYGDADDDDMLKYSTDKHALNTFSFVFFSTLSFLYKYDHVLLLFSIVFVTVIIAAAATSVSYTHRSHIIILNSHTAAPQWPH
jgi:hypothetical protein